MTAFFTVDDYLQPEWAAQPQHKYYFQIIKDGSLLGKLDIRQKSFNLVGRLQDLCDIFIDNQTVSRKHAILQARQNDHCLYLYDLGSAHGTFVNKEKLPMRTYKKLAPFDNVKFGVSSRVYVMRCPQYQELMEAQQAERENKFSQMIQEQKRGLSKEELKQKYLDMLENDPYFHANQAPRKLMGRGQPQPEDQYEGIDWGITDQREIYAYRNESEMPIQPDVLRRLNLDSTQLTKLAEYEEHLRKYQQVEGQLNQLTSREKRQFGLEQKLQGKKQKLQKKFVEALEALQKSEDWLRVNIFGQKLDREKKTVAIKQKENDTFGDDQYLDRTLENKQVIKKQTDQAAVLSTQDYWRLQKQLKDNLKTLQEAKTKLQMLEKGKIESQQQKEEEDQLQLFMKANDQNLDNQNMQILKKQIQQLQENINTIKNRFKTIMGLEEINKIKPSSEIDPNKKSIKEAFHQKSIQQNLMDAKRKMEQNSSIESILNRLENAVQQDEEVNELDPNIFKYYKNVAEKQKQAEQDYDELDQEKLLNKLRYEKQYDPKKFQKPISKYPRQAPQQTIQQESIDLTKQFK